MLWASYQHIYCVKTCGTTLVSSSRQITEVKQRQARLALGLVTAA